MDKLNSDYQRSELDHEREKHFNRDNQLREQRLQEDLRLTKARIVGAPLAGGTDELSSETSPINHDN